jgi:hypothetical protein
MWPTHNAVRTRKQLTANLSDQNARERSLSELAFPARPPYVGIAVLVGPLPDCPCPTTADNSVPLNLRSKVQEGL